MTLSTGVRQTGHGRPPSSYTTAHPSHRRWPHGTRAHSRVVPKQTGHSSALGCLDGCLDGAGWAVGIVLNSDEPPPVGGAAAAASPPPIILYAKGDSAPRGAASKPKGAAAAALATSPASDRPLEAFGGGPMAATRTGASRRGGGLPRSGAPHGTARRTRCA